MANVFHKYLDKKMQSAAICLIPVTTSECSPENMEYEVSEISDDFTKIFGIPTWLLKGKKVKDILTYHFSNYDYYSVIFDAFSTQGPDVIEFYSQTSEKHYCISKCRYDTGKIIITITASEKNHFTHSMEWQNRHDVIFDCVIDAMWECDIKGNITDFISANESYKISEFVGMNIQKLMPPEEIGILVKFMQGCMANRIKNGEYFSINYYSEKICHYFRTQIIPSYDNDMLLNGFYGILSKTDALQDDKNEKTDIYSDKYYTPDKMEPVSYLSHEIRTPLNSILCYSQLFETSCRLSLEQREYISHIQKCSAHILNIANNALTLAKIKNGSSESDDSIFCLADLIEDSIAIVAPVAEKNGNRITHDSSAFAGKKYSGDASKLEEIIINLLGNASKFTNNGNIAIECKSVSETSNEEEISISVTDNGIGIARDKIQKIFNPFFGSSKNMKNKNSGAGIGLSLSNHMVKLMGGKGITVESEPGAGSNFHFNLKLKKACREKNEKIAESFFPIGELERKINILIIEDDDASSRLICKLLESNKNISATIASNEDDALIFIESSHFDIILMDLNIHAVSGIDLTRKVRNSKKDIPIIAVSGEVSKLMIENCYKAGMNDFISKPFKINELTKKITDALNIQKDLMTFSDIARKTI